MTMFSLIDGYEVTGLISGGDERYGQQQRLVDGIGRRQLKQETFLALLETGAIERHHSISSLARS